MAKTTWQPNDKQKLFMETIKSSKEKLTLSELSKLANVEFKTGTINYLVKAGLVKAEQVEIECDIVRKDNKEIVGSTKKKVNVYSME